MIARIKKPNIAETSEVEDDGPSTSPTRVLFTTRRYPIYYLAITKCGCTYLKNLFYYLDHDLEHPSGTRIHGKDEPLVRASDVALDHVLASRFSFAVVRDPVERFLSFYFDKVYGDHPQNFEFLRQRLTKLGLKLEPGLSAADHRANCTILLDWLAANARGETDVPENYHWRAQSLRLRHAVRLKLTLLTLDGLDWQLPLLLHEAVPGLAARMATVGTRNAMPRPVDSDDLLDPELRARIDTHYTRDRRIYQQTRARWDRGRPRLEKRMRRTEAAADKGLRVLAAHHAPLSAVVTAKVGCTWLRNLFYLIDHDRLHPDPVNIADDECLHLPALSTRQIASRGPAFFVVRDPGARFLSFYFDKVLGTGPTAFARIAARIARNRDGFHRGAKLTLAQHRENCRKLLAFMEYEFETLGPAQVNPHFRPQSERAPRLLKYGLVPLQLDQLVPQLLRLVGDKMPELPALIDRLPPLNVSRKAFSQADILTPDLAAGIAALYAEDAALYARTKAAWDRSDTAVPTAKDI